MKHLLGRMNYWKMAAFKASLQAFVAGIGAFLAATQAVDWMSASGFTRFCLILGALIPAASVINAFCDQTMAQLKKAEGMEDTTFVRKAEVTISAPAETEKK